MTRATATARAVTLALTLALTLAACSKAPEPADSQAAEPSTANKAAPAHAVIGAWGFDVAGMDTQVKPGDDFYKYSSGHWLASNTIPPDQRSWGQFTKLAVDTEVQVRGIIDALPKNASAGSNEQKVHDFFQSYVDVAGIDKLGFEPANAGLKEIAAAKTHADIARLMGRPDLSLDTPIGAGVTIDEKNPDRYVVGVGQSGLSLPDRDYYLKDDAALSEIRKKFLAHIEKTLQLVQEPDAAKQARAVLDVETQIAKLHWPVAKRRERELTYNLRTRDQLEALNHRFPWNEMLTAAGLQDQKEFVVAELDAVQALAGQFTQVPVDSWRSYLKYHYLISHASVLPQSLDDESFDFYGRVLTGVTEKRDRWKRAIKALDGSLGEAVGQLYVKQYFPEDSKRQVLALVENLRRAYGERIDSLTWMSAATKQVAKEKLATFRPKIGYPDKWKDYSKLEVRAGDAFGNAVRAQVFDWQFDLARLNRPTDKDEWFMTPQTINAYYNPVFNEVVFPAAILQPPYFDPHADPAINYGGIGGVIGHEMGHGFDDQGAKSDAKGVLRTWWQPQDEKAFKKLVDALVAQYDAFEVLPGLHINGRLTVGENIGDLGGLTVAHQAYHLSLGGKEPPVLDGFTGEQRFFLSWAQVWRELDRQESLRNLVMSNPHSPAEYRVQGVVRNVDAWYEAFGVKEGDKMYLPPDQRVHIW